MAALPENIKESDILPLRQQEIDLIFLLRKRYRFGNVEIVMRDGVPIDVIKTIERTRLGDLSTDGFDTTE